MIGIAVTALLAAITVTAWSPPDELKRRLLKRSLRRGVRDPNEAYRNAELLLQRIGMVTGMALFVSAFLTGWIAFRG